MSILSNRSSLPNGIILKPDMNWEERDADSRNIGTLLNQVYPKPPLRSVTFTFM